METVQGFLLKKLVTADSYNGVYFCYTDAGIRQQSRIVRKHQHYSHISKDRGYFMGNMATACTLISNRAHREIRFDTLYETGTYEAVAVLKTRIGQVHTGRMTKVMW